MELDNTYFEGERYRLVESLRKKGIKSKAVLKAIGSIKRENFMLPAYYESAYVDKALPIDAGQTISQPFTVAYMTEQLDVYSGCKVLEIGTGSGYQTAILDYLKCDIYTIERVELLHHKAKKLFAKLEIKARAFLGDGSQGLPEYAPYHRIIITAAAPDVPMSLASQLEIGGKMVVPVGSKSEQIMTVLMRIGKDRYEIDKQDAFRFVPLIGKEGWSDE